MDLHTEPTFTVIRGRVGHVDVTTRVLVVDDEAIVRTFVSRVLSEAGYEVTVAVSGTEALEIARRAGPFDLLLADEVMPEMRGDEVAEALRRWDPELQVLYLTGYCDRLFEAKPTLWDGEAYLEKPASVRSLLEAVSLLLFDHVEPTNARTPSLLHGR